MSHEQNRLLVFGAHPDDCDIKAGGLAALYAQKGHRVKFVSVTNGDAGHHQMGGEPLATRRNAAAQAAARAERAAPSHPRRNRPLLLECPSSPR